MMERMQMKMLRLLLISFVLIQIGASNNVIFYEPFDEKFEGRWIVSQKADYNGIWKHSKSEGHEDYGLLVSEKARKYGIVKELDEAVSLKDGTIVLQYEVRLQDGMECGGAYLKYLRPQDAGWKVNEFDNESPYSIMFGPDRCGITNKVHFIFKHKNPKTGVEVEHHLRNPPFVPSDKLSHVYTSILKPNNDLKILIDGEEKTAANFLADDAFDPPLIPPKTIPDPDEKKPEDWDDRAQIPDPDAVKPDDWDEDAPMEIEDEDAEKPEGWLDNESEEIDDPEATKPEDWDDEEDGTWEPPKVPNPECATGPGCGEWKRPMKPNPDYKGKWHAPLIDNPNYKGVWKPKDIPNPDYFELDRPNFEPIAAIGIEIWTMQGGILFDNILIARDEKVAETYRETGWKPKFEAEKAKDEAASGPNVLTAFRNKFFDLLYNVAEMPSLEAYKTQILDLVGKAESQPNVTVGVVISIAIIFLTMIFKILFGSKKTTVNAAERRRARPAAAETSSNQGGSREKEDGIVKDNPGGSSRRRSNRRET